MKVRPFLSAKTIDMVDYVKPTQRDFNPDVYLLHVGTIDLSSNISPEQISLDILNLANKRRWLFIGMYKPPSQGDREFTIY